MQLITLLSTASAMIATVSATRNAVTLNQDCKLNKPYARVINRCPYDVHLWSVFKGTGCPSEGMVTLKTGETYAENYETADDASIGVSIKISKTEQCKDVDITQLEYFRDLSTSYKNNYLDVSYVDCLGEECPTRQEGYYLVAGNQTGAATASAGNTWCPVLACTDAASCSKLSYVLPDDVQTKTCDLESSIDFYMCGGEAPSGDYESTPESPVSSTEQAESSPAPTSASDEGTYTNNAVVAAAAVTTAPEVKEAEIANQKTKTQVVYVTAYEYVNAKRHAHGHARRHQPFHA